MHGDLSFDLASRQVMLHGFQRPRAAIVCAITERNAGSFELLPRTEGGLVAPIDFRLPAGVAQTSEIKKPACLSTAGKPHYHQGWGGELTISGPSLAELHNFAT